jgi:hypothetical protein
MQSARKAQRFPQTRTGAFERWDSLTAYAAF